MLDTGEGLFAALDARACARAVDELRETWRPVVYDPTEHEQRRALDALLRSGNALFVHDTLREGKTRAAPGHDDTSLRCGLRAALRTAGVSVGEFIAGGGLVPCSIENLEQDVFGLGA
jgi:hypothetical protein